ncbi:MAG: hypothetical protein WCA83_00400 [Azonexus sp.]
MTPKPSQLILPLLLGSIVLTGCVSRETKPADVPPPQAAVAPPPAPAPALPECKDEPGKTKAAAKNKKKSKTTEPDCIPKGTDRTVATTPAAVAQAPASADGYDLSKNKPVTDSAKAVAGEGTKVKGINDWQGEISGIPAANSRFTKLRIGMSEKEAKDLVGQPTDEGQYVTGKAFIPFYFGSDRIRWEMAYKGQGRLIFAQQSAGSSAVYLIWIIHNANDRGYR